jgi:PAS domain-containing protein
VLKRRLLMRRQSPEKFQSLRLDPRPLVACDWNGRVLMCNRAAELLSGWTEAEVLGLPLDDILRPASRSCAEGFLTRRRGTNMLVRITAGPLWDKQDRAMGTVFMLRSDSLAGEETE